LTAPNWTYSPMIVPLVYVGSAQATPGRVQTPQTVRSRSPTVGHMRRISLVSLIIILLAATIGTASAVPSSTADKLTWHDCRTGPSDEQGKALAAAGATCATVKVPLDHTSMLIIQPARDSIPLRWAETLHRKLPNSTLRIVDRRAHGVYDARVPEMVTAVNNYLA